MKKILELRICVDEGMKVDFEKVGSVTAGSPCACGLAWGHTGKHAPKMCDHGTDLNYFCEDCDGAKITEGIDREHDEKVLNLIGKVGETVEG